MSDQYMNDPMQEVFIFETSQQLEQMEQSVIKTETLGCYPCDTINEIFRIMHTIKSSAAMMLINNMSVLAHTTEDLFYFIREENPENIDVSVLSDLVFEAIDFMKLELEKIKDGNKADEDPEPLREKIRKHLVLLKEKNDLMHSQIVNNEPIKEQYYISANKSEKASEVKTYQVILEFEEDCGMENIRAFTVIHNLKELTETFKSIPEDVINDPDCVEIIKRDGFILQIRIAESIEKLTAFFSAMAFIETVKVEPINSWPELQEEPGIRLSDEPIIVPQLKEVIKASDRGKDCNNGNGSHSQSMIAVSVEKLDKLMNLVGEMVISESMVTQNPDLKGLVLDNFSKSARQLKKITNELQDMVMSIRMVPLGPTFAKMNRIVRDISKKLDKEINLKILGEETEVDKNIIEQIGDPLMHIVRNSVDHGIETADTRIRLGKPRAGTITLEAKNAGGEVLIVIKDDGKGLNKEALLKKGLENGLINDDVAENMSDADIFNLIFAPGFSTKEAVTEFSGRGVGMDVVAKNIEAVGGNILVESVEEKGTTITLKIPLTLAIIEGMNIRVGESCYTLPIMSIKESFIPKENEIIKDTDENEMIMIRGQCYPIMRLKERYKVKTGATWIEEGILIMLEGENKTVCLFADELLGEQQVVVKTLPRYIRRMKKIDGLAGCTLLGDGNISLILDVNGLIAHN
ncbi:chemotaxis protein CheA [Acetobacterium woodii]|uniref:Chemotaxis protein CheA n=1 Tax=Acetobacterium woodii (strain ATCC 29683 / DSM 1030 / JCM 2381 / KCTC 1655 / WB1) TaxID=931626 RepID=H6LG10_ACEWD|nr:chemotaxis protein CheA [Acetobacterium woodii]AFA48298.1 chemotaxis protein histidine kinase CheA1 [Acetobacterium woodii DSM 1030]